MDRSWGLIAATVLIVVVISGASGPLVGAVDLSTEPGGSAPPGTGSADATVNEVPETVFLEEANFGAGTYHLSGPSARVTVGTVSGNPLLEYVIHIPALDFTDIKTFELRKTPERSLSLTFRPVEISPKEIDQDEYDGRIEVRLQSDEFAILYEEAVTVEVRG